MSQCLDLLNECLKTHTIKSIADELNISPTTIKRWMELNKVPENYVFDLHKMLSKEIDYSKFTHAQKDQFFTPISIAAHCWKTFIREISINISDFVFVEPSAGDGSFLKVLPQGTIAFDIEPRNNSIQKQDYLLWKPKDGDKYVVFGNPPFGLRGNLALKFINHSSFADYVCFILPQLFVSDGKGSPRKRVKGFNLVYSEKLTALFYTPDNQNVKINGVFQIWAKYETNEKYDIKTLKSDKIKIYSLSDGGTSASTRNVEMIDKCDIYLPSTCFGAENMRTYDRFDNLPGKKGYGVVFLGDKKMMINKSKNMDWVAVSFLSTNSSYNLRTSIIISQLSAIF